MSCLYHCMINLLANSEQEKQEHLDDDDAEEHAERIDRGIADSRCIALDTIISIGECHRVGHAATKCSIDGAQVHLAPFETPESNE